MARRTITVEGERWTVYPAGHPTPYVKDQFGLLFELGTGPGRKRRFTRFVPGGARATEAALAELSDEDLYRLWRTSQPAWTAPEAAYGVR